MEEKDPSSHYWRVGLPCIWGTAGKNIYDILVFHHGIQSSVDYFSFILLVWRFLGQDTHQFSLVIHDESHHNLGWKYRAEAVAFWKKNLPKLRQFIKVHPWKLTKPKNWWFGSIFLLFQGIIFRFQPLIFGGVPYFDSKVDFWMLGKLEANIFGPKWWSKMALNRMGSQSAKKYKKTKTHPSYCIGEILSNYHKFDPPPKKNVVLMTFV